MKDIKRNMILDPMWGTGALPDERAADYSKMGTVAAEELVRLAHEDTRDPITDVSPNTGVPMISVLHLAASDMISKKMMRVLATSFGSVDANDVREEGAEKLAEMLFMYGYTAGLHGVTLDTVFNPEDDEQNIPSLYDQD